MKLPKVESYPSAIFNQDFDKISACNSVYFNPNFIVRYVFMMRLRKVLEILSFNHRKSILDVGTGIGILLPSLAELGEKIFAVDIHDFLDDVRKMCYCENIQEKIFFNRASCTHLPFKDDSFNSIVCLSVLEHIVELEEAINELYRKLSVDGVLILGYPIGSKVSAIGRTILKRDANSLKEKGIILDEKNMHEISHHESAYTNIRKIIRNNFENYQRIKIPFTWLPDFLSLYEIVVISK